jgi:hypothetical protein
MFALASLLRQANRDRRSLTIAEQDYFRDLGALINLVAAERREGDRPEQSSTKRQ